MPRITKLLATLIAILNLWNPMNSIAQDQSKNNYGIVIHGGAGGEPDKWTADYKAQRTAGLKAALDQGVSMLKEGKSALDVVEQVVRVLEDDPIFNAGRGCVLNEAGEHELDASIMDGSNRGCGSVASVRKTKHPISLARRVMTDTKHVFLIGNGADEFGRSASALSSDLVALRGGFMPWRCSQTPRAFLKGSSDEALHPNCDVRRRHPICRLQEEG